MTSPMLVGAQQCPGCQRVLFPTRAYCWPDHYHNPAARPEDRVWCRYSQEVVAC